MIDSSTLLTREHSMDFFYSLPLILSCWQILPRQRFKVPLARGVSCGVAVIMIGLLEIVLILLIATCCTNLYSEWSTLIGREGRDRALIGREPYRTEIFS